jgi:hypothetical protein
MANLSNINNKFLVTTGGDVGIGATSPRSKLEVNGGIMMQNGENLEWGDTYANNAPTIFAQFLHQQTIYNLHQQVRLVLQVIQ